MYFHNFIKNQALIADINLRFSVLIVHVFNSLYKLDADTEILINLNTDC